MEFWKEQKTLVIGKKMQIIDQKIASHQQKKNEKLSTKKVQIINQKMWVIT